MTLPHVLRGVAGPLAAALWAATAARAQVAPNRTTAYFHPTDVRDARALWVNPAGLGVVYEASVHLEVTVGDPGPDGRLRQVTAGFNSRGLSAGYQRDVFDAGLRGHTYRVGFGSAAGTIAAGLAATIYRGGASATGYDLGVVWTPGPALALGAVVANLGEPVVRGLRQDAAFIPGLTVRPLGPGGALSAHARVTRDSVRSYSFGIRWRGRLGHPVSLLARLDTDNRLRRGALAFGLTVGSPDELGVVVTTPGDLRAVDAASLSGVASRPLGR